MSTSSPRFHSLTVRDVRRETADAVSVAFEVPSELADAYAFAPGQYLTLRATLEGEDMRRSYSICSGPGDADRTPGRGTRRRVRGATSTVIRLEPPSRLEPATTTAGRCRQGECRRHACGPVSSEGPAPVRTIGRARGGRAAGARGGAMV